MFQDEKEAIAWTAFATGALSAGPSVDAKRAASRADELLEKLRERLPGAAARTRSHFEEPPESGDAEPVPELAPESDSGA